VVIQVQPETPDDGPAEPDAFEAWRCAVHPVHTHVPGRARFKIPRLYRCERLKRRLESRLSAVEGVRFVRANVLTGSLLVGFSPTLSVGELVRLIAKGLGVKPPVTIEPRAGPSIPGGVAWIVDLLKWRRSMHHGIASTGLGPALVGQILAMLCGSLGAGPGADGEVAGQDAGVDRGLAHSLGGGTYNWHRISIEDLLAEFSTSADHGLTTAEAEQRLARFGPNLLPEPESRSELSILTDQIATLPVAMLGVSAAISVATAGYIDAVVILGVVVINAIIGFVTERQSERTIRALTSTAPRHAHVLRNGLAEQVPVANLVPGDVLLLSPGSYVAADLRLLKSDRLTLDESALTGESMPVSKDADYISPAETPLAEHFNMAFMGTMVTGGAGRGVVVGTATNTELGQIQSLVTTAEAPETPMQRQLGQMGRELGILSALVCAGVFGVGLLRGHSLLAMLKSSVSLAVAAVPEGLTAVATTTLALGIKKMRSRRVAVRHLDAVENLGSVQVFCLDKTGTLTLNHMSVTAVSASGRNLRVRDGQFREDGRVVDVMATTELQRLLEAVSLCSETRLLEQDGSISLEGSPTENALVEMAMAAGLDVPALRRERPQVAVVQRAEGRPYMSTTHAVGDGGRWIAVKGSPREVLVLCAHQLRSGRRSALQEPERSAILRANERMAGDALRVLGVAYGERTARGSTELRNLTWLGLVGMADPLRAGMPELMQVYHRAGIQTVMITGDQSATAFAIGKEVLDSSALEKLDPKLLAALVRKVNVFARVTPAHKLRVVQALQDAGYVVAMTGDGINDGPALKAADVGVAMGEAGTDVARSVADVVLEDDNLHTMAVAVGEGRTIYSNHRLHGGHQRRRDRDHVGCHRSRPGRAPQPDAAALDQPGHGHLSRPGPFAGAGGAVRHEASSPGSPRGDHPQKGPGQDGAGIRLHRGGHVGELPRRPAALRCERPRRHIGLQHDGVCRAAARHPQPLERQEHLHPRAIAPQQIPGTCRRRDGGGAAIRHVDSGRAGYPRCDAARVARLSGGYGGRRSTIPHE
jgi:Ca2+-transporting ATPase